MDLLLWWLSLRWLAELLRSGDTRSAGERLDSELDSVRDGAAGCLRAVPGCCLAYVAVIVIVGGVGAIYIVLRYWITGK